MDYSRTPRRTLVAAGTTAALVGVFVSGVQIGRGADPVEPIHRAGSAPFRLASAALEPATSCDALLESYRERALDLVGPWGWEHQDPFVDLVMPEVAGDSARDAAGDAAGPAPVAGQRLSGQARTSEATSSETGTNVQEAGVDEPDTVKTDGELLVRIRGARLTAHDVTGATPTEVGSLTVPRLRSGELLLTGDDLAVVVGTSSARGTDTRVVTVDLSDPAEPTVVDDRTVEAPLLAARLHDDVLRVVTRTDLPELDFITPDSDRGRSSARRHNEEQVRRSTLADWLPHSEGESVVDCEDVAVPSDLGPAPGTVTTLALVPGDDTPFEAVAVASSPEVAYFSADRLHLAATPDWQLFRDWGRGPGTMPFRPTPEAGRTSLYSFALDGTATTFVAAGEVEGRIEDRWAMDAADGILRVAVGPTQATGNFNSVVTFAEEDGELVEQGRVDRLGVGEEIKSVRWFDDLALLVTFRQVDPLYAVDLTDPARPTLVGELKIPGFSEYLHPLGPRRMIGIGQDADLDGTVRGAQAALFNVRNLADLRRMHVVTYPDPSRALAGDDPRQFTWLPRQRTALTVVAGGLDGRTGWVSALRVHGGRLHESRTRVEYGSDVAEVRLVPLPSGKVVLVTEDDLSFFDVT